MKKICLSILFSIFLSGLSAQTLKVNNSNPTGLVLQVSEPLANETASIIELKMEGTDKDISLKVEDFNPHTTTQGTNQGYYFKEPLPKTYLLNKANNHTVTIELRVRGDQVNEKNEEGYIIFSWESLTHNATERKAVKFQVIDAGSKTPNNSTTKWVRVKDSSNTHKLELVQFTDFLGFENDRPNGLLQQEFRFKWAINENMTKGKSGISYQFFRSFVFPDILFNRIDKSKQEIDYSYRDFLPGTSSKDSLSRKLTTMDIWKYSNLQISARLILFALHTKNFRVHAQTGIKLLRNRPAFADTIKAGVDSGKVRSDFRAVYSFAPNAEIYIKSLLDSKTDLNMDLLTGIMFLRLKDSYYAQYDASETDEFNRVKSILPVSSFPKRGVKPIYYVSSRLAKDWGENNSNAAFFRINYFYQPGTYERLVRPGDGVRPPQFVKENFSNHYLQLQLGVALGLEELFKTKDEKKEEDKKESKKGSSDNIL